MKIKGKDPAIHGTAALGRSYWGKLIALQTHLQEQQDEHVTLTRRDILEGLIDFYLDANIDAAAVVEKNAPACADKFDKRDKPQYTKTPPAMKAALGAAIKKRSAE